MAGTIDNGDVIHALHTNLRECYHEGYVVLSGAAVSINNGTLGNGNGALSVGAGDVLTGGTSTTTITQTTVDLPESDPQYPRWDMVVVESAGTIGVRSGDPASPERDGDRLQARDVMPPALSPVDATPLALVWVSSGANAVTSDDLFNIRPMGPVPRGEFDLLNEGGNRVATRLWSTTGNIAHGDLADAPANAHHTPPSASDGGTEVLPAPVDFNFGTDLAATDDGDGTVTVDFSGSTGSGGQQRQADYIVYNDGGTIRGHDLQANTEVSNGSDTAAVLDAIETDAGTNADRTRTVALRGSLPFDQQYTCATARMAFVADGAYLFPTGDWTCFEISADHCRFVGGTLDGANQVDGNFNILLQLVGCDHSKVIDVTTRNAGYYGINIDSTNECEIRGCHSISDYRHGFHAGTGTAGRNQNNWFIDCVAEGTVNHFAFSDRGTTVATSTSSDVFLGNIYQGCVARDCNGGIALITESDARYTGHLATDCVVRNATNESWRLTNGNHSLKGCWAINGGAEGFDCRDVSAPADPQATITLMGCRGHGNTGADLEKRDINVKVLGGRYETTYTPNNAGHIDFRGAEVPDSAMEAGVWKNGHAKVAGTPDATNYRTGMTVENTNDGTVYLILDETASGGHTTI